MYFQRILISIYALICGIDCTYLGYTAISKCSLSLDRDEFQAKDYRLLLHEGLL